MLPPSTVDKADWPPNYVEVFKWRQAQLLRLRASPELLTGAFAFYATRPVDFINHWAITYDPRNAGGAVKDRDGEDMPATLPFIMFRRQAEFVAFLHDCLRGEACGLVEKSRDMGATWLCAAFSVWAWLFLDGAAIGWGSRKEQYVDKIGDPDSIFEKIRRTIWGLPREFWPAGFNPKEHMTYMKIINPANGATITGESGDNIGRGGRSLMYFKDESSHYDHPELIEAALGDNTRIQIDISSVNGLGNVFQRKREKGLDWEPGQAVDKSRTNVFVMDWRDHPTKTEDWYNERRRKAEDEGLLHKFAQEVDRDYAASLEGVIIPAIWVQAAVDAHIKLGFDDSGAWAAALDVADEGGDTNALAKRKGVILKSVREWGERDTGVTARRAVAECEGLGPIDLQYDCIGVGAGVKAETNRLADEGLLPKGVHLVPWNAGAEVLYPDKRVIDGDRDSPINKDFFQNFKAQAWWALRRRFETTYRALHDPDFTWLPDELISLPSGLPLIRKLTAELSQPTVVQSSRLKLMVDKRPEGTKSPNIADAVVMAFYPARGIRKMEISPEFSRNLAMYGRRR